MSDKPGDVTLLGTVPSDDMTGRILERYQRNRERLKPLKERALARYLADTTNSPVEAEAKAEMFVHAVARREAYQPSLFRF